jgi:hypothetical protein
MDILWFDQISAQNGLDDSVANAISCNGLDDSVANINAMNLILGIYLIPHKTHTC